MVVATLLRSRNNGIMTPSQLSMLRKVHTGAGPRRGLGKSQLVSSSMLGVDRFSVAVVSSVC